MEVKKQKWLKVTSVMLAFMMMLFCTGLNLHAKEVKDGILVTVSSDKENYNSEDEVKLKITVKNTNDFEVSNIKMENILPDGISLVSGDISKDSITLKANEEYSIDLIVKKESVQADTTDRTTNNARITEKNTIASKSKKLPNTGDSNNILIALIVMLISIAVMIICFWKGRKKHLKILSLFLCLGVIGTFEIIGIVHASSENNYSFTYEYTYKIDKKDYVHKVVVSYGLQKENNDKNNTDTEKKLQSGYLLDVKENFVSKYNFERVKWDEVDKNSLDYLLVKNVYVEIENAEYKTDNTGIAKIIVTAPDLEDLLITNMKAVGLSPDEPINAEYAKGEEFQKDKDKVNSSMCDMLKNGNYKKIKTSLNVNTTKINQIWQIEYTNDVHGAITCHVNDLFEKYVDKMFKGE